MEGSAGGYPAVYPGGVSAYPGLVAGPGYSTGTVPVSQPPVPPPAAMPGYPGPAAGEL